MQHFEEAGTLCFCDLKTVFDGGGGRILIREDNAEVGELGDDGKLQVLLIRLWNTEKSALLCGGRVRLPPFVRQATLVGNKQLSFAVLHLKA